MTDNTLPKRKRMENAMTFETLTVTQEGENATLTGSREEILELLSYGCIWTTSMREAATKIGAASGAATWQSRWQTLNRLFRTIAR